MKLSIIVPVYNVEKYIEECLDSIYNGNLADFEVLCIDDKGNDLSINIIEKYVEKNKKVMYTRERFKKMLFKRQNRRENDYA